MCFPGNREVVICCDNSISSLCVTRNFTIDERVENVTITFNGVVIVLNSSFVSPVTLTNLDVQNPVTVGVSIDYGTSVEVCPHSPFRCAVTLNVFSR